MGSTHDFHSLFVLKIIPLLVLKGMCHCCFFSPPFYRTRGEGKQRGKEGTHHQGMEGFEVFKFETGQRGSSNPSKHFGQVTNHLYRLFPRIW